MPSLPGRSRLTKLYELPNSLGSWKTSAGPAVTNAVRSRLATPIRQALGIDAESGVGRSPGVYLHHDPASLVGGLRSLLVQVLHPSVAAAVAEHSRYRDDPWGRLRRTVSYIRETTGTSDERAGVAIGQVAAVHAGVVGTRSDGVAYRADDPHLLAYVHAAEVESILVAVRRYGQRELSEEDADRYVSEMARAAERLGAELVPHNQAELHEILDGYRDELGGSSEAREVARFLVLAPTPAVYRLPYSIIAGAAVSSLPAWARRELGLPRPTGLAPVLKVPTRVLLAAGAWSLRAP